MQRSAQEQPDERTKGVLRLAWPLVVSFTMRSLFNFVDTFYAGILGDAAIAAIGLTIPLEFVFIATWVGTSNGLTSLLSRAMGARESDRLQQLVGATLRLVAAFVPLFVLLGGAIVAAAPRLGLEPEVARNFAIYAGTLVAGIGLTGFWSIIPDSLVKAHHDTRSTMVAGILSNIANVVLNTVFLFAFGWGIFGIALSTVLSRFAGLAYAIRRARTLEDARRERWRRADAAPAPGVYRRPVRRLLALALPSSAGYLLMSLESAIVAMLLARLPEPTSAVAAWSIYFRFLGFGLMPIIAGSVALLPYVARSWGARDMVAIRSGWRTLALAALAVIALVIAPVYIGLAEPILRFLTEDPETLRLGIFSLHIAPLACLAAVPFILCRPLFEGMQRSVPGMLAALLRYAVLTFPLAYLGLRIGQRTADAGYEGLILGLLVVTALSSLFFGLWARRFLRARERALVAEGRAVGCAP